MNAAKPLFDTSFQALQRARAARLPTAACPLKKEAQKRLVERLSDLKEKPQSLILSCLEHQNSNDLFEEFRSILGKLDHGGLFLGVLAGGRTLNELRTCLMEAEIALTGGAHPRVAPMLEPEDLARLMQDLGFSLPVVDVERLTLCYPDLYALMHDLRHNGWANALHARSHSFAPRSLFCRANEIYAARFPSPKGGGLAVTVDLVFLHGWREGLISV